MTDGRDEDVAGGVGHAADEGGSVSMTAVQRRGVEA